MKLLFLAEKGYKDQRGCILTKAMSLMSGLGIEPGFTVSCTDFTSSTLIQHLPPKSEQCLGLSKDWNFVDVCFILEICVGF